MWSMVALVGVLLLVVGVLFYRLWKLRQVGGTARARVKSIHSVCRPPG